VWGGGNQTTDEPEKGAPGGAIGVITNWDAYADRMTSIASITR